MHPVFFGITEHIPIDFILVPPSRTPIFLENSPVAMRFFVTKAKSLQLPLQLTGQSNANDPVKTTPSGYPLFSPDFISYFFGKLSHN